MLVATLVTVIAVIHYAIQVYIFVIIAAVIMSWLLAMGALNMRNNFVRSLVQVLDRLTEPVFRRVRRFIPPLGPLDISPMLVIIVLWAIDSYFLPTLFDRIQRGLFL